MRAGKCPKCGAVVNIEQGTGVIVCDSCGSHLTVTHPTQPTSSAPPVEGPTPSVAPPPAMSPHSTAQLAAKKLSKTKIVLISMGAIIVLVVIGAIIGPQGNSGVEGFEKWASKKQSSFSIPKKESIIASIANFPSDPSQFAQEAERVFTPLRQKCQDAITDVRNRAKSLLKDLLEKQVKLEDRYRKWESERTGRSIDEIAERRARIEASCNGFEKYVRGQYEEILFPARDRYSSLRGLLWQYDSKALVKRYFVCGSLVLLQCGAPDHYYHPDGGPPKERESLIAVDTANGKERWITSLGSKLVGGHPLRITDALVIGEKVYIATSESQVVMFDADSGRRMWDYNLPKAAGKIKKLRNHSGRLLIVGSRTRWKWNMPVLVRPNEDGQFTELVTVGGAPSNNISGVLDCFDITEHQPKWVAMDALTFKPLYTQDEFAGDLKSQNADLARRLPMMTWVDGWGILQMSGNVIVFYAGRSCYSFDRKAQILRKLFEYDVPYVGVTPVIANDLIIYFTPDRSLAAWSLAKNEVAWSSESELSPGNFPSRLHTDGDVVVYAKTRGGPGQDSTPLTRLRERNCGENAWIWIVLTLP